MQQPEYHKMTGRFPGLLKENEPLASHVRFRVGGPADLFCSPPDIQTLSAVMKTVSQHNIPFFIMGDGTNLLIRDGGLRGLVIRLGKNCKQIRTEGKSLIAGCAAKLPRVCLHAAGQGLSGLETLAGIPGTVGGAIAMNAGTAEGSACDHLQSLTICEKDGRIRILGKKDFSFGYRLFRWNDGTAPENRILLEARWELQPENPAVLRQKIHKALVLRKASQPVDAASAGCIFKNPDPCLPAGRLIDEAGLKGTSRGAAMVSPRHANFIINQGSAQASDILSLMACIQETVLATKGITLEREVRIVGENTPV
nr:UDP-N-acetylmuramate dehydrogenase [Desulfobotulus pelophilus]